MSIDKDLQRRRTAEHDIAADRWQKFGEGLLGCAAEQETVNLHNGKSHAQVAETASPVFETFDFEATSAICDLQSQKLIETPSRCQAGPGTR